MSAGAPRTVCVKLSTWPDAQNPSSCRTPCAPSTPSAVRSPAGNPAPIGTGCPASCPAHAGTARPTGPRNPRATDRIWHSADVCPMVIRCKFEEAEMTEPKPRTPRRAQAGRTAEVATVTAFRQSRSTASPRSGPSSGPTSSRSTSSVRPRSTCSGIDRWVRNFQYIVYYDSWDGGHPRVFTPKNKPYVEFESSEHDQQLPAARPRGAGAPADGAAARRWSPWSSSTRRPRRSARSWATT